MSDGAAPAMADAADAPDPLEAFLAERHLATLTTIDPDGRLHAVPVGFTWEPSTATARVITSAGSVKVRNIAAYEPAARAVLCQVDGARWVSLEGRASIRRTSTEVTDAERRYALRYRAPRPNPERVVIVIQVDRILGPLRT